MTMLRHMVIHQLSEKPRSGYGICSSIEESTGQRPSYGSVYPILRKLNDEGMVTIKEQGRKKIYSLTTSGKAMVKELEHKRDHLVDNMQSNIRGMGALMGIDPAPLMNIMERLKKGQQPLGKISGNMFTFRNLIFEMNQKGITDKHSKEINTMLKQMITQLRKMQ